MKTRQEIIRALIAPAREAADAGNSELIEVLADIYGLAGHFDEPDELAQLIYAARSASMMMPSHAQLFTSIAAITQDELLTRHRAHVKELYRLKTESARAWLEDYLGSSALADVIEREVENEVDN